MRMESRVLVAGALALLGAGCASTDGDTGGGSTGDAKDYVAAYCAYLAECGTTVEAECLDDIDRFYLASASTVEAAACATELRQLDCDDPPSGCELYDLYDSNLTRTVCMNFASALCQDAQSCEGVTPSACEDQLDAEICSYALAFDSRYDACLAAIQAKACAVSALPSECEGVISSL